MAIAQSLYQVLVPIGLTFSTASALQASVVHLEIGQDTLVDTRQIEFLRNGIENAGKEGAKAIVITVEDCPGGLAWETGKLADLIGNSRVPVVAYLDGRAVWRARPGQ